MSRFASLLLLSLGLIVAGCGKKSSTTPTPVANAEPAEPAQPAEPAEVANTPKATPSDAELESLFGRTLDFLDKFADAIANNEKDCSKMATAMTGVFDEHKTLLAEAKAYEGNAEVDAKVDAYMETHKPRVDAAMGKMMKGMQACAEDPEVQKAMESFDAM
jgi:Skp family chaperone for outer membrane proteins